MIRHCTRDWFGNIAWDPETEEAWTLDELIELANALEEQVEVLLRFIESPEATAPPAVMVAKVKDLESIIAEDRTNHLADVEGLRCEIDRMPPPSMWRHEIEAKNARIQELENARFEDSRNLTEAFEQVMARDVGIGKLEAKLADRTERAAALDSRCIEFNDRIVAYKDRIKELEALNALPVDSPRMFLPKGMTLAQGLAFFATPTAPKLLTDRLVDVYRELLDLAGHPNVFTYVGNVDGACRFAADALAPVVAPLLAKKVA